MRKHWRSAVEPFIRRARYRTVRDQLRPRAHQRLVRAAGGTIEAT